MQTRRTLLTSAAAGALAALTRPAVARDAPRVVVIGGGFAGASAARTLKALGPNIEVVLVETSPVFTSPPGSNAVVAGLAEPAVLQFGYDRIRASGVAVALLAATGVDAESRNVRLADGTSLPYDRLIIAPGIDIRWGALSGYDEAAAARMPHAWKGGGQVALLRRQVEAMQDGGLVVISVADNPLRCPVAPYERASLIAHHLKERKPRSKLIVLDAKESFSMQRLFQDAWSRLYPGLLEWVPLSKGGNVASVDPKTMTVETDFDRYEANVANVIPPQRAGRIAQIAGVADRTGWCPIDPATFESPLRPGIHIVGDAAISGAIPKSAHGANAQGKACAAAVAALLAGKPPPEPKLDNICTSLVAPDYGISIWGAYRPGREVMLEIEGSAGTSPRDAPSERRASEARDAAGWYRRITGEVFG